MILKPLSWIWTTPDETLEIAIPGDYDCREAIANGRDHGVGSTCGEQVAYESNVVTVPGGRVAAFGTATSARLHGGDRQRGRAPPDEQRWPFQSTKVDLQPERVLHV
jgi:hypothetical protein